MSLYIIQQNNATQSALVLRAISRRYRYEAKNPRCGVNAQQNYSSKAYFQAFRLSSFRFHLTTSFSQFQYTTLLIRTQAFFEID